MPRVSRALVVLVSLLAAVLATLGLMLALAAVAAKTAEGRAWFAQRIAALVSDNIPGRLEIGEVAEIDGLSVRATDVRFFHPDGRCVLRVEHALVELNLAAAWDGQLAFRRVVADHGALLMAADPDGRLAFEAVVSAPSKPGPASPRGSGLQYDLRDMHAEHFALQIVLSESERYELNDVSGMVHVRRVAEPATRVWLRGIKGSLSQEVAGAAIRVSEAQARIDGSADNVVDGRAQLLIDGEDKLSVRVRYAPKRQEKISVRVLDKQGAEATALTWLMHAAAGFSGMIGVEG